MLRSRGFNATRGITATEHNMCIKFGYKQLITFGIPQCSPAGTAKQDPHSRFGRWYVKRDSEAKKNGFRQVRACKNHRMFKHSSCCVEAKYIYLEGVMEMERLARLSFQFEDIYFPKRLLCFYMLTELTMSVIQIKPTKVLQCNSSKL